MLPKGGWLSVGFVLGFFVCIWVLRTGFMISLIGRNVNQMVIEEDYINNGVVVVTTTTTTTTTAPCVDSLQQQQQAKMISQQSPAPLSIPSSSSSPPPSSSSSASDLYCLRNYKYVLLSTQRSGTHYFTAMMGLNPNFNMGHELFKQEYAKDFQEQYNLNGTR